ncbi:DUF3127 domain-containing protein [Apibacter muscae]|uniref:DUF3127 domain-containing protein n=1 Tax=Apibacter muscae TaxID=2509004 RepID=UPI0011ABD751|nr:DUF3127 domain-containing protein [Apibacter muscae]TWP23109.1 DUF3127 domain-containing protein [Apibacter muscae]
MEIEGKIKLISEVQTFDSGFKKREVVITTEEQYPQHILIELLGDRTEITNSFKIGDQVKIGINLRGREWVNPQGETKYFNSITGWKIEKLNQVNKPELAIPPTPTSPMLSIDDDDLPF